MTRSCFAYFNTYIFEWILNRTLTDLWALDCPINNRCVSSISLEFSLNVCFFFNKPGTGVASVVISFFMSTYYSVIIAYAIYYFFTSFKPELPWTECSPRWSTPDCWNPSMVQPNMTKPFLSRAATEEFFEWVAPLMLSYCSLYSFILWHAETKSLKSVTALSFRAVCDGSLSRVSFAPGFSYTLRSGSRSSHLQKHVIWPLHCPLSWLLCS